MTTLPRSAGPRRGRHRRLALALGTVAALLGGPVVLVSSAGGAAAAPPADGATVTVTGVGSGKVLDVSGASQADGREVIQYTANGNANQQWTARSAGGSAYTLINVNSGKCLTVAAGSTAVGAAVVQQTCAAGTAGQSWTLTSTATEALTVSSVTSRLCLDVTGASTADGARIIQWTCTGRSNQQWLLTTLGGNPAGLRVGAWAAALNPGGRGFSNVTVRQIVHTSVAGTAPQLRLSNLFGTGPLGVGRVDVAVQASGGTAVAGSHRTVTFGGATAVTVAAGREQLSDPVDMAVAADTNLLVSIHVANAVTTSAWHPGAIATSWVSTAGDHARDDGTADYPTTTTSWYLLSGLSVVSRTATGTLVAFGDSITDGLGATRDADRRYPDHLARRLAAASGGPRLAVVNAGISGNQLLRDAGNTYGHSALRRFSRDALAQPGVTNVLLLEGINDLKSSAAPTAAQLIEGYRTLIDQAHAAGVAVHGGTLLAWNGWREYTPERESVRQSVNAWIRTGGAFDSVVDFDAVTRDPAEPSRLRAAYDSGDHLHPNSAGYQAMAAAVDLARLRY